ncbi:phosphoenolpyruvate--protein phosphotransferase [Echinimonas agarilytica]|uniref:phosphoenolpyruvate--protein phosphotransferase n=1 Tax=Echinimonas agarilytica TaxID=1215918 RepID=A0AA42B783_9GAMM|nr:phosphoenolpyruvate--protein phosphotransferase [Echinimonas agarilytica]MCM2679614.1 phosphoenolpyruvate--protein phosphotransferase [Echinimonas agarilytica]
MTNSLATAVRQIILTAPINGTMVDLNTVPDPLFAQQLVGKGVAIYPKQSPQKQSLIAPCSGEITLVHSYNHAAILTTESGIEILLHIGVDTILLKGEGFEPQVKVGDTVQTGDTLITFDTSLIEHKAASSHTMMVVTNAADSHIITPELGDVLVGDSCLTIDLGEESTVDVNTPNSAEHSAMSSGPISLPNPAGLHARPSANLVAAANKFSAQIDIKFGDKTANARSLVALLGLGTRLHDSIEVLASGDDAQHAIDHIRQAIVEGLGEDCAAEQLAAYSPPNHAKELPEEVSLLAQSNDDPNVLQGVAASPGLAIGQVFQLAEDLFELHEHGEDIKAESELFVSAVSDAKHQLSCLKHNVVSAGNAEQAEIFDAHMTLLDDPDLTAHVEQQINTGKSAAFSWQQAIDAQCNTLKQLDNEIMAGRVADLEDVCKRVLRSILDIPEQSLDLPDNTILVARDLTPSMTVKLDTRKVVGFATSEGGSSSHSAILARSMDIPAIAAVGKQTDALENGANVVLDGFKGTLKINVTDDEIKSIKAQQAKAAVQAQLDLAAKDEHAVTNDGHTMEIVANIGNLEDSKKSMTLGAEGVGLLRSEFLFLDRNTAPSEDEQFTTYNGIVQSQQGQPVIIRTLDVGGDKPLDYMPMPTEENPFLGERGIRIGINRPSILKTQVRAILRAAQHNPKSLVRIMFPMISTIEELRAAKGVVHAEAKALNVTNFEVGIMVEVPSTAVMADLFAKEADFFSIGSNDLTQYTLAIDRGHPKLAAQVDGIHPSVLRLIELTCKGAHKYGKWVGVCGGIASDTQAVPLLIGLGVDELSVSVPSLPAIKAHVRELSLKDCQSLAQKALDLETASQVRALSSGR